MALDNEDHEDPLVTVSSKRKVPCTSWSAAKWKTELSWMNKLSEAARGAVLPQYQSWRERFIGSGQRSLLSLYLPSDSKGYCGENRLKTLQLNFLQPDPFCYEMAKHVKFDKREK